MTENYIPRLYNYNLETGTVGTDNEDMANILYSINRMETTAAIKSEDHTAMIKTVNDAFTLLTDCNVSFDDFNNANKDKIDQSVFSAVSTVFSAEQKKLMNAFVTLAPADQCAALLTDSYRNVLSVIPSLQKLDDQAAGRI